MFEVESLPLLQCSAATPRTALVIIGRRPPRREQRPPNGNTICLRDLYEFQNTCTVDSLVTHTPWETPQIMGFDGLWGIKVSAQWDLGVKRELAPMLRNFDASEEGLAPFEFGCGITNMF